MALINPGALDLAKVTLICCSSSICADFIRRQPAVFFYVATAALLFATAPTFASAQVQPRVPPAAQQLSGSTPQPSPSGLAAQPTSLLQEPAKPAEIQSTPDQITVRTDNSSLTQTLRAIAEKTGMRLDGLGSDQRVFGTFGPGAPKDVINALLTGTDYNIVMVGSLENGAPRQLILSPKRNGSSGAAPSPVQAQPSNTDDDSADVTPDDQPAPPAPLVPQRPGDVNLQPGAQGVRTPQQMLQQLQQMHQVNQSTPQ